MRYKEELSAHHRVQGIMYEVQGGAERAPPSTRYNVLGTRYEVKGIRNGTLRTSGALVQTRTTCTLQRHVHAHYSDIVQIQTQSPLHIRITTTTYVRTTTMYSTYIYSNIAQSHLHVIVQTEPELPRCGKDICVSICTCTFAILTYTMYMYNCICTCAYTYYACQ